MTKKTKTRASRALPVDERDVGENKNLSPSLRLLVKIGSIAVHVDEMLSPDGHEYDRQAILHLLQDPEVSTWIKEMGPLLPRKRSS